MKTNPKFHVKLVKNSKPVGRAFKRKNNDKVGALSTKFKPGNARKKVFTLGDVKQNKENSDSWKVKSTKFASSNGLDVTKSTDGSLKKTKELKKRDKLPVSQPPLNGTSQDNIRPLQGISTTKRKFSEVDIAPVQEKHKEKKLSVEEKDEKSTKSEPLTSIPVKGSKKKKKKKKKQIPGTTGTANEPVPGTAGTSNEPGTADVPYKPVLIVRGPKDFSANWKNLKDVITQGDKERAKMAKEKMEKIKQYKEMIADQKQKRNQQYSNKKGSKLGKSFKVEDKKPNKENNTTKKSKMDEIWFDNVDPILIGEEYEEEDSKSADDADGDETEGDQLQKDTEDESVDFSSTKAVAMDCEMVGVGLDGKESILARVSIVNQYCEVIYDKYVKPTEAVVDYRTEFSGIRPDDIKDANDFKVVQREVAEIIDGKILVGHGLNNDLRVLFLQHPRSRIRDTARYKLFKTMFRGFTPKLKMLTKRVLGADIQTGEHDSVQDAQAVMRIYTVHRKQWDRVKKKRFAKPTKKKAKTKETE